MLHCFHSAVWGVMVGIMVWGAGGKNLTEAGILFEDVRLDHRVGRPQSPVISDFNGDGRPDVVVTNFRLSLHNPSIIDHVSVLLGNGDGTLDRAVDYPVHMWPSAVAVGDLNGDNQLDLVAANNGSNDVSVLLGNGDGTFRTAFQYPAGEFPGSLAISDLNGDGYPDLAVASDDVWLLLGNGDGTFQAARSLSTGNNPGFVMTEDLDGDRTQDLVVVNYGSDTISVLLGNGDGTFQTAVNYPTGDGPRRLAAGDLNGDGKIDLVTPNEDSFDASVLLGKGDGTFSSSMVTLPGVVFPYSLLSVSIGDLDEDGRQDLVFGAYSRAYVALGRGDGTFQSPMVYKFHATVSVALGDLNGDGHLDLVTEAEFEILSVLLGHGDGTFSAGPPSCPVGAEAKSMAVGDLNGDGRPDVATANSSGSASLLLGSGDGTLRKAGDFVVGSAPVSIAIGDLNGDGRQDLVTANQASSDISLLLGNGDGTFRTAKNVPTGPYPVSLAVADLNGDARLDVVTVGNGYDVIGGDVVEYVSVLFGNGDSTFQAPVKYPIDSVLRAVAIADLNGDERPDLAVVHKEGYADLSEGELIYFGSNGVSVFLNNGDGTFQSPFKYPTATGSIAIADLNGDGRPDLAVGGDTQTPSVWVLLNNGDGTFQVAMAFPTGLWSPSWSNLAIADLNGDERADLVMAGASIRVLLGNGDGTFLTQTWVYGISGWLTPTIGIGDMNGDGRTDLVVAKSGSDVRTGDSTVSVLLSDGGLQWSSPGAPIPLPESSTFVYPSTLLEIASSPVYAATSGCERNELEIQVNLGPYEAPVDLYIGLTPPDGQHLLLDPAGDLTPETHPYFRNAFELKGQEAYRKLVFSPSTGLTVQKGWWALDWLILSSSDNGSNSADWGSTPYEYGKYYFYVPTLSAQWREMDGVMARVSAGSADHIWGVSQSGFVFEWDGDHWEYAEMDGSPQISVGCEGTVLALFRADGRLLESRPLDPANPFDLSQPKWNPVPSAPNFVDISVGNSSDIWGVTQAGAVFRKDGGQWVQVEGTLRQVSVGCDGTVWGVDSGNQVLKRVEGTWQVIPGELKQISVGCEGVVWGVDTAGRIYMREGDEWIPIEGELQQISAACDGTVWGVNSYNQVFRVDSVCPYRP